MKYDDRILLELTSLINGGEKEFSELFEECSRQFLLDGFEVSREELCLIGDLSMLL